MKPYVITKHAIEQSIERLGRKESTARNDLFQRMQTATYQGRTSMGRIFDHYESRTRFVLALDKDTVITVYSMDTAKGEIPCERVKIAGEITGASNAILAAAHATIKRELAKARRTFIAEFRKLKIEQAELGVEIAQATVNKVRCKAPHTQELIQQRIDASQTYYDVVGTKIERVQAEYNRTKTEAQAFLGTEVAGV